MLIYADICFITISQSFFSSLQQMSTKLQLNALLFRSLNHIRQTTGRSRRVGSRGLENLSIETIFFSVSIFTDVHDMYLLLVTS